MPRFRIMNGMVIPISEQITSISTANCTKDFCVLYVTDFDFLNILMHESPESHLI
jgi:hypothetical protein